MTGDPGLYAYSPIGDRPPLAWPGGARVALWVAPNLEFYELDPPAGPVRPAWPRPHPDVLGYGQRDYGNRVGFWRLLEVLDRFGIRGSAIVNVALFDHHPEILEACQRRGWEFLSHGIYNTRYLYGLDEAQERGVIQDAIDTVLRHTGWRLRGWLSPALTNTPRTLDLLAEQGLRYTADLFHDDQPFPVKVRRGTLTSLPYSIEVNDGSGYLRHLYTPRQLGDAVRRQFDTLYAEGERSGRVVCVPLHPFLSGHPHRLRALRDVLAHVATHEGVWLATGAEIVEWYETHHRDPLLSRLGSQDAGPDPAAAPADPLPDRRRAGSPGTPAVARPAPPPAPASVADQVVYARRARGMDHDRYPWSPLPARPPLAWPGGSRMALWILVPLQWFPIDRPGDPARPVGAVDEPFPDYRSYTHRDYGNRVGAFRLMETLDGLGLRATAAVNAAVARRYPALVAAALQRDWEIAGHGLDMSRPHHAGLGQAEEEAMVAEALATVASAAARPVEGWLSPGLSESPRTPDLLAAAGVRWVADWVNDDLPYRLRTATGSLWALPCGWETSDAALMWQAHHSPDEWAQQLRDRFDQLHDEAGRHGGRLLGLTLHPWVAGQPHRIGAVRTVLEHIVARGDVWPARAADLVRVASGQLPAEHETRP